MSGTWADAGLRVVWTDFPEKNGVEDALQASAAAYWDMDETSGTRADSKDSNHLEDLNSVDTSAGKVGNALSFNAVGDYARLTGTNLSFGDASHAIAFWVKFTSVPSGGVEQTILTQSAPGTTYEYSIGVGDYEPPAFFYYSQVWSIYSNTEVEADTWYFVIFEYNAENNTVKFYINNALDISDTSPENSELGNRFALGREDVTGMDSFRGLLDEVLVLNRVTTSDERAYLYNSGAGRNLFP